MAIHPHVAGWGSAFLHSWDLWPCRGVIICGIGVVTPTQPWGKGFSG